MDQTYYQTATMLPASKQSALLPRPQGDGMDSETLKIRELTPSRSLATPARNRQNLASSPRTATVSKNEKAHFIPHEPVKGAVKPLVVASKQIRPKGEANFPVLSNQQQMSPKRNSQQMSQSESKAKNWTKLNMQEDQNKSYNYSASYNYGSQQYQKPVATTTVRTINVPVYNAPGHLSQESYKLIERQQKLMADRSWQTLNHSINATQTTAQAMSIKDSDTIKITMLESGSETCHQAAESSGQQVALTIGDVLAEVRQVEGDARTASMADLEKLNDEINELRRELENQCKVNTDLKKLLVASMGDDLHHKVDRLVQDKQQLAAEVGNYTKKMYQDYEDIDKLSIQADIWRSKFKASRVMADQLSRLNTQLTQTHQSSHQALQRLLQERHQLKDWLAHTHRFLYQIKTAFEPKHAAHAPRSGPQTLLSLTQANLQLADCVKFRLLGPILSQEDGVGAGTVDALSPAEAYAFQVLSTPTPVMPGPALGAPVPIPYTVTATHTRFHPAANHDNLTFNICSHCKGEIHLV